jgi:m7GpppX diphosphatase
MVCIVHRRDLLSLRDLRGNHVDYLVQLKKECLEAVKDKYGLEADELRLYIHCEAIVLARSN